MIRYGKLVRDGIPAIIKADGGVSHTRILEDGEFDAALWEKFDEEKLEARESGELGEFADLQEVLNTLAERRGYSPDAVEAARIAKSQSRGSFAYRIFLESVD